MKVVILAGGYGTRLAEETDIRPKPMVQIGGWPIIWHIMKLYSHHGFNDFIVCLGYKGYMIKEYFANYFLHQSDVTIDMKQNSMDIHDCKAEHWKITLVDTGQSTSTGGRIKRVKKYIGNEPFMMTYGDGVGNVPISDVVAFHRAHKRFATVTAVQPAGRFGTLDMDHADMVRSFLEKPKGDGTWINAGFFVLEPAVFDYIAGDTVAWESEPLDRLAAEGQLAAYRHHEFWKCMDTLRDKVELESLWNSGAPPWKVWED